jgi:DNA-binding transcriptional ArsR family regulator
VRARPTVSSFGHDFIGDPPGGYKDLLARLFIIPPFSVLDARTARWQERKWWWNLLLKPDAPESQRRRAAGWLLGPKPLPVTAVGVRIVLAVDAEVLNSGEKLIWLMHRHLSEFSTRADPGVVNAAQIGRRLGMRARNVEKARRLLKRAGLLDSIFRRGKRGESWWATMPLAPTNPKNLESEIKRLAAELGEIVRVARASAEKAAP